VEKTSGAHIFQKSELNPKIVDFRTVTAGKFHTEGPQILGDTAPNSVTRATRNLRTSGANLPNPVT